MREKDNVNCPDKNRPKISRDDINSCGSESFWDNIEIQKNELTQKIQDSDAKKYRNKILFYLNDYINTLNFKLKYKLTKIFQEECIKIYDDVLDSLSFCEFYKSFGVRKVKNPNYIATSLIYFNLARLGENIARKDLAKALNLSLSSLNSVCSTVSSHLKGIPGYDFILELINADRLTEDEYLTLLESYIDEYIEYLNNNDLCEIKFYEGDSIRIFDIFWNILDSIEGDDNFKVFFGRLKKKKPHILATILCFMFLKYEKDVKLNKRDFLDLLLENENFYMPPTNFTETLHQIMLEFFVINQDKYRQKVENYLIQYIDKLESYLSKNLGINFGKHNINRLNNNSIESAMAIFDYAIVNDFLILDINRNNEIDYYFPQDLAFSLLYYTFKKIKGLEDLATPAKLEECFGSEFSFKHVNDRSSNRLYDYITDYIGRYKGQIYSRETFIKMMKKSLKEFYHLETDFLLRLYQTVDMSPVEFGNELNIHNTPGTSGILRVIKKKTSFTEPQTFLNIKRFIAKNLLGCNQKKALHWINNIQKLRRRDLIHQSVTYPFRWNESNLKDINNDKLRESLYGYLYDIWKDNFPRDIFMSSENPRASMLKFFGTSKEPLKINEIKNFFKNELQFYDSKFFLCQFVQNIYNNFKKMKIGKIPDHNPILNNILMNCQSAIGIEIPVWKPIKNSQLHYIGHIDLLLHQGDKLIIADYKLNEQKIFKALPQLTAYAIMVKDRLEKSGVRLEDNIICVGFSKDLAYTFKPESLFPKMLQFVKIINSKRKTALLSKKVPKNTIRTDLYDDLLKLK